jgi:hypothetical protein
LAGFIPALISQLRDLGLLPHHRYLDLSWRSGYGHSTISPKNERDVQK